MMPRQQGIFVGMISKNVKIKFKVTSIGIFFWLLSNNTPSSTLYLVDSKIKSAPEEEFNEELTACIGDGYYYFPLVIDDDLYIGDMNGGNFSLNNHTLSQQYFDFNNGDVCSEYGF